MRAMPKPDQSPHLSKEVIKQIKAIVGEEHTPSSKEDLICYSYDATNLEGPAELVVFPGTAGEISEILKLANKHLFPVVPRGMGTGFKGGSVPIQGGVVLVMTRFNGILEVEERNIIRLV